MRLVAAYIGDLNKANMKIERMEETMKDAREHMRNAKTLVGDALSELDATEED